MSISQGYLRKTAARSADILNKDEVVLREDDSCKNYGTNSRANGLETTTYTNYTIADGQYSEAGTRSFRLISGDISACTWHLHSIDGIEPGMWYTVRLFANYDMVGKVVSVLADQMKISVDAMPNVLSAYQAIMRTSENLSDEYLSAQPFYDPTGNGLRAHPSNVDTEAGAAYEYPASACFDDFDTDYNTLWIYRHPELGELSSYATGAHAEGYYCQASRQFTHAEGLCCVAIGKYAHAEGWQTDAVWAAHSEGRQTKAYGQTSHTEGIYTQTRGSGAHAEGHSTIANGMYSHTEGERAIANFAGSFVWNGDANKNYSDKEDHTFNINPKNGIGGFYIGEKSLAELGDSGLLTPSIYRDLNIALDNIDDLRSAYKTISSAVDVRAQQQGPRGLYPQYRNGKMNGTKEVLSSLYGSKTVVVTPGETLSITTNVQYQAGIVGYDLNQNMISSWNTDDNYVYVEPLCGEISTSISWANFLRLLSEESGITEKYQMDEQTIDDRYHWSRLHYEDFSTYIKKSHDAPVYDTYVIEVPDNCYLLKIANLQTYALSSSPDLNPDRPTVVKHMREVIDKTHLNILSGETWSLSATKPQDILRKMAEALGVKVTD